LMALAARVAAVGTSIAFVVNHGTKGGRRQAGPAKRACRGHLPMSVALPSCGLRIVRRKSVQPRYSVKRARLRVSWLDPRLHGDAWLVPAADEAAFLMFNRYPLAQIHGTSLDVASLNQTILRMRRVPRRACG